ncbi:pirin family protein [Mucilaginibacter pallidiroseus]|uniref:Pirin family protein n=1 Tax=Mucilaginibacter pallidiroseus TaxID=2599295 RepID=A0A563UC27_9SPHI|nr:pirin family protein [Mucilaginibacter pallidiroseus]TWR28915.1 pirin family protein [Mucilaginibacter pallidiroseus]
MENFVIHRAGTRGYADHGWLKSSHTFSFAGYYNHERVQFGALRVLNDDYVAGGRGFGDHPHDNMEIISIPLEGKLIHKDSMGNSAIITTGEIQVMSAGTGIYHTEYNADPSEAVKFLQIWIFPNKRNVTPRYDQMLIKAKKPNELYQVLSPNKDDAGVWIHQNAWFNMGEFDTDTNVTYKLNNAADNGVYILILKGQATINGQALDTKDGMGIWAVDELDINAQAGAQLLLMEVPMEVKQQ